MVPRCAGCVDVLITPLKCEGHGRNKAENLPFATNPTGQNPDLKAKITSKIESKNGFAFLKGTNQGGGKRGWHSLACLHMVRVHAPDVVGGERKVCHLQRGPKFLRC